MFGSLPTPSGPGGLESGRTVGGRRGPPAQPGAGGGSNPGYPEQRQRRSYSSGRRASAAALQAASPQTSQQVCGFCDRGHPTEQCPVITSLPVRERMRRVRFSGLCFRCLKRGHPAQSCEVQCEICCGRHHRICCFQGQGSTGQAAGGRKGVMTGDESSEAIGTKGVKASLSCNSGGADVLCCQLLRCWCRVEQALCQLRSCLTLGQTGAMCLRP